MDRPLRHPHHAEARQEARAPGVWGVLDLLRHWGLPVSLDFPPLPSATEMVSHLAQCAHAEDSHALGGLFVALALANRLGALDALALTFQYGGDGRAAYRAAALLPTNEQEERGGDDSDAIKGRETVLLSPSERDALVADVARLRKIVAGALRAAADCPRCMRWWLQRAETTRLPPTASGGTDV